MMFERLRRAHRDAKVRRALLRHSTAWKELGELRLEAFERWQSREDDPWVDYRRRRSELISGIVRIIHRTGTNDHGPQARPVKTYKLWVEIEEYDPRTGEYRSLTDEGSVSPVPIGHFSDLDAAVRFAEALGVDPPIEDIALASLSN